MGLIAKLTALTTALSEFVSALQAAKTEWNDPATQAFIAAL